MRSPHTEQPDLGGIDFNTFQFAASPEPPEMEKKREKRKETEKDSSRNKQRIRAEDSEIGAGSPRGDEDLGIPHVNESRQSSPSALQYSDSPNGNSGLGIPDVRTRGDSTGKRGSVDMEKERKEKDKYIDELKDELNRVIKSKMNLAITTATEIERLR